MPRTPRIRPARVASLIQELVASSVALEVNDPRVAGVTISDVEVTGDLQEAHVYFHIGGGDAEVKRALEGLQRASGFLRRKVGQRVQMRRTPRLIFRFDRSLDYGAQIEERLRTLGLGQGKPEPSEPSVDDHVSSESEASEPEPS